MQNRWKKFFTVALLLAFSAVILLSNSYLDSPVINDAHFIFLFIAYITVFLVAISREIPLQGQYVRPTNRRAPPK